MEAAQKAESETEEYVPIVINSCSTQSILSGARKCGTLPTEARMNAIFQRMITQLDFISRTIGMMNARLDCMQSEIDEMRSENDC